MKFLEMEDIAANRSLRTDVINGIINGSVFIYPTDTIYGIGCNATVEEAVLRIRRIKYTKHPFSVIAPSIKWIYENLEVKNPDYIKRFFPGPYTLIMRMKKRSVCREVADGETLGVRVPDHPFTQIIQEAGVPFVTTSANMSGETPIWNTVGIPHDIERNVDMVIHEDILNRPASAIIDITGSKPKMIRRATKKLLPFDAFEQKKTYR